MEAATSKRKRGKEKGREQRERKEGREGVRDGGWGGRDEGC